MRPLVAALALVVVVAPACTLTADDDSMPTSVERCVDRMTERVDRSGPATDAELRRYVERTYCRMFARRGWLHADGRLRISGARKMLAGSEDCEPRHQGCGRLATSPVILDCAILHLVPRREVRPFIQRLLRRRVAVQCDDGTPLDRLGAVT